MAGLHSGYMTNFSCWDCRRMPGRLALLGCEEKARRPAYIEEEDGKFIRYFNCPKKFIPPNVKVMIQMYNYHKTFPSAPMPRYENASARFVLAAEYYESKLKEFSIKAMENK